jgi:hypothetical protein
MRHSPCPSTLQDEVLAVVAFGAIKTLNLFVDNDLRQILSFFSPQRLEAFSAQRYFLFRSLQR